MVRSISKTPDESPLGLDNIQHFFCGSEKKRIFCSLIRSADISKECVIYFPPLFEERMWCQRVSFNFARDLAARGKRSVLIFDYYGYGESDGHAEDFSLSRCRSDVYSLISVMQEKGFTSFVLWGIRTGCAVALASVVPNVRISSAILWAPVFDLKEYLYGSLRATMATEMSMFKKILAKREVILEELVQTGACWREGYQLNNIEGYRFGKTFYQEMLSADYKVEPDSVTFPTFIAEISSEEELNGKEVVELGRDRSTDMNSGITRVAVPGRKFWLIGRDYSQTEDALYQITCDWLNELSKKDALLLSGSWM